MKNSLLLVLVQLTCGFAQKIWNQFRKEVSKEINVEYADSKTSPLTKEDLASFKTLDFYPINEEYFVLAQFTRTEKRNRLGWRHQRIENHSMWNMESGIRHRRVPLKLNIYKNIELSKQKKYKNYLFCPFQILLRKWKLYWRKVYWFDNAKGNTIAIDFNKSYNPYCA
jgi:hypothetical protein